VSARPLPDGFPALAAGALTLRAITSADAPAWFAILSDPLVVATTSTERAQSVEEVAGFIESIRDQFVAKAAIRWAIADSESSGLIGACGFNRFELRAGRAEIGYEIARARWGHGVATAAAGAVVRYGFAELDLHRIEATVMAGNAASARVLEKLGFRREGLLRDYKFARGQWADYWMYARLASDAPPRPP
jgi:ribosomal-protein-alanine N-acetyltransferase